MALAVKSEVGYLGAEFTTPDTLSGGNFIATTRASPDEGDRFRVPLEVEVSTEMPGGFGPGHIVLKRPPNWDIFDSQYLLGGARSFDQSGRIVHEGEIVTVPQTGVNEITVELRGWSAQLEANQTFRQLYVDADWSAWGEPSIVQRQWALNNGYAVVGGGIAPSQATGLPELWQDIDIDNAQSEVLKPWVVNTYYAPDSVDINDIFYSWRMEWLVNQASHFFGNVKMFTDDTESVSNATADLVVGGPGPAISGTGTLTRSGGTRRVARVEFGYVPTIAGIASQSLVWRHLAVYGTHGVTRRGSNGTTSHQGFYASDVILHIVNASGMASHIQADASTIEDTTLVIPHCVFREDTTVRAAIESLLLLGGSTTEPLDWWIDEDRTFRVASPSAHGTNWRVRRDDGALPDFAGYNATERPNGVMVAYNDGVKERRVGPDAGVGGDPYAGGVNAPMNTSSLLRVTDPNHPGNRLNQRIWPTISIGINSLAGATTVGQVYLAEKNRNEWLGGISQTGPIKTTGGAQEPPYMVRAGDRVVDETDPGGDYRDRYISATTYNSRSRTVSMTISPRAQRFDVLLARLELAMQVLGPGGTSRPGLLPKPTAATTTAASAGTTASAPSGYYDPDPDHTFIYSEDIPIIEDRF